MKSIVQNTEILYEIKNSKFYTFLYKVDTVEEVKNRIKILKEQWENADHYCYAYIIDGNQKCSDDGEPSGTAGMPILNVLKQKQLDHIVCVVIRYFGGIKLGAGGLVRAYSKATSLALEKANIIKIEQTWKLRIEFSYSNLKQINYLLKDCTISYKEYDENIIYEIIVKEPQKENLEKEMMPYVLKIETLDQLFY